MRKQSGNEATSGNENNPTGIRLFSKRAAAYEFLPVTGIILRCITLRNNQYLRDGTAVRHEGIR